MIPFIHLPTIEIGPITIYTWGLFVAIGILTGFYLARREAKKRGIDEKKFERIAFWILISGFIGARLGHILFYEPTFFLHNPLEILKIWHGGMSSMGAFFAAAITGIYFVHKEKLSPLLFADCTALGLTAGWTIGRIGCFLIHDHPGTKSDFMLATKFPDGSIRHDLGLYDGLVSLFLVLVVLIIFRKKPRTGIVILTITLIYSVIRFFLDYFRVDDAIYFTLTPAQYACILLIVFSSASLIKIIRNPSHYGKVS